MPITIQDLTVNFDHLDREAILNDWRWLVGASHQVILITAVGDAFLQHKENGSIQFLDTIAGELQFISESADGLMGLLQDRDFVLNYFGVALFADLQKSDNGLTKGQIYSYKHPPVLGGEIVLENIEATDIDVHFALMGQIHQQASKMADGTPISGIKNE
jgi:hypothetical protein